MNYDDIYNLFAEFVIWFPIGAISAVAVMLWVDLDTAKDIEKDKINGGYEKARLYRLSAWRSAIAFCGITLAIIFLYRLVAS